ncbi:MAG TPA: hypothetical protein VEG32_05520 [Clostridia bacterium]|nr:hypothetical protein [Clostridia bacterium]
MSTSVHDLRGMLRGNRKRGNRRQISIADMNARYEVLRKRLVAEILRTRERDAARRRERFAMESAERTPREEERQQARVERVERLARAVGVEP